MQNTEAASIVRVHAVEHMALNVCAHRNEEVFLQVVQRTTGDGRNFIADLGHVSRLVSWLVGVVGRQPRVKGYGTRTPDHTPLITLVRDKVGAGHTDTMTWVADGQFVLVGVQHHSPNPTARAGAHFERHALGDVLDWLAAWHLAVTA